MRRPEVLEALLPRVAACDRLVLLGDAVELRQDPPRIPLAGAAPVLAALREALGGGELVLVPGNHDHGLLRPWFEARGADGDPVPLSPATAVDTVLPLDLGPVTVSYPGVWLREDVYATHGHYLDRHTTVPAFERVGAGLMARLLGQADPDGAEGYERVLAPMYAWIDAVARGGGRPERGGGSAGAWKALSERRGAIDVRRLGLGLGFKALVAALNRAGAGPLQTELSGHALRRSALIAMGEVVRCLRIDARWVLFGHTHRAGPLPGDDHSEWQTPSGARLINTGCWVREAFAGKDPNSSYRAGFAVELADGPEPPQLINLAAARAPA